jgi:hypothetical protein
MQHGERSNGSHDRDVTHLTLSCVYAPSWLQMHTHRARGQANKRRGEFHATLFSPCEQSASQTHKIHTRGGINRPFLCSFRSTRRVSVLIAGILILNSQHQTYRHAAKDFARGLP